MSEANGHGANGKPATLELTKKDFSSDQETRWCPGCGDYAILASVQSLMPELGIPPEKIVFVTGIGCGPGISSMCPGLRGPRFAGSTGVTRRQR